MTDYEYILQQAKKFHFTGWNDEELRKCVDMLVGLTHVPGLARCLLARSPTSSIHNTMVEITLRHTV